MALATENPATPAVSARQAEPGLFWRLLRKPGSAFGMAVVAVLLVCALFPALVAPHDPYAQSLMLRLRPPSFMERGVAGYFLGTDQLGRDTLSRIVYGARTTLVISVLAVAVSAFLGVWAGLLSGYFGGRVDAVILRLIDMQLAFPVVLLVIAMVAAVGPSMVNLIILMGLSGWPRFARIVRGSVLSVRSLEYIDAARAIGAGRTRIMLLHILPNILSAIVVYASFELARMVLLEATLSFLGLGVQPPTATWGGMINDGKSYLSISWAASLFPGIAIALAILAVNLLGDDLRDTLDPQLRQD
jgi:peptide/nickel transport system permease protein